MNYDDLIKQQGDDVKEWHRNYGLLADAVDVSRLKYWEVLTAIEKRAFDTGDEIHAISIMMMHEYFEFIDGMTVLARAGASRNCAMLLRSALETSLGIQYVLEDAQHYTFRSTAYEYFHHRDELSWLQKSDPDHQIGKTLRKELEESKSIVRDALDVPGVDHKSEISKLEKRLNKPRFDPVRTEIERMKKEEKQKNVNHWYSLWGGPKHIRDLAKGLNMLSLYEVLYRAWSNTAHGGGALKRIVRGQKPNGGQVSLHPIRSPLGLPGHCIHAVVLTNALMLALVSKLVPELRDDVTLWNTEKMQPAFKFLIASKFEM